MKKRIFVLIVAAWVITALLIIGLGYLFVNVYPIFPSFKAFLKIMTGGVVALLSIAVGLFLSLIFPRFFFPNNKDDDFTGF